MLTFLAPLENNLYSINSRIKFVNVLSISVEKLFVKKSKMSCKFELYLFLLLFLLLIASLQTKINIAPHIYKSTACMQEYCLYTRVLRVYKSTACIQEYCVYTRVPHVYKSIVCIQEYFKGANGMKICSDNKQTVGN